MTDELDPTQVKTLQEMREEITELVKGIKESGKVTENLQKYLTTMGQIISDSTDIYSEWDDTVDQVKDRIQDMVVMLNEKKDLAQDEVDIGQRLAIFNEVASKMGLETLKINQKDSDTLRAKLQMETELISRSKIYEANTLRMMRARANFFTVEEMHEGQAVRRLNPILAAQESKKKIQDDILNNLTREEAQIVAISAAMGVLEKVLHRIEQAFSTFAKASADLNKMGVDATQYTAELAESFNDLSGVPFDHLQGIQKDLISSFSMFTQLSRQQRIEMQNFGASMTRLGLDSNNYINLLQMTTKSFNLSLTESTNAISKLKDFSEKTGISMTELNKNVGELGKTLANFGKNNYERVFQSLSIAAKNTGVSVGELVSISEKFTTFQSAAQMVGELNIALGTQLDTMSLMKASFEDPIKIFEQLKREFDRTGKSFDELAESRQRYIASIFGKDVQTASALFGQSLGAATAQMALQAKEQKELAELAAKSSDVMQRLEIMFQKIATSAIVVGLVAAAEALMSFFEVLGQIPFLSEGFRGLVVVAGIFLGTMLLLRTAYLGFAKAQAIIQMGFKQSIGNFIKGTAATVADTGAKTANTGATLGQAGANETLNKSVSKTGPGLVTAAAAAALFGIGIGAAAYGVAQLAKEIKGMSGAQMNFLLVIIGLIGAMMLLAAASLYLAPALAGGAAAFGLMMVSLSLMAAGLVGVYFLIKSLIDVYKEYADIQLRTVQAETALQDSKNRTIELTMRQQQAAVLLGSALVNMASQLATQDIDKHLTKFAEGIRKIAVELDKLPDSKVRLLQELNKLSGFDMNASVENKSQISTEQMTVLVNKGVAISDLNQNEEVIQRAKAETAKQIVQQTERNQAFSNNKEIRLVINAPLKLDGMTIGNILYDGIPKWERNKAREMTAGE